MEGQSSDEERGNHGYLEERSFNSVKHRRRIHISMSDALNGKAKETLKQDRISDMTDSILLHILSFLPTKDAIKTGILSHRWLYLWTSVPNLHFTCTFWRYHPTFEFVNLVDKTLLLHKHCHINKFMVNFHYDDTFASSVDMWIRFATSANVEELGLVLLSGFGFGDYRYMLPHHVYMNSSMTTLKLTWCDVVPNGLISWKSLKSLLIGYTTLSEDVIEKILVGAPVLESLELDGCYGFNQLEIGSASLRKLVVREYWDSTSREDDFPLEISAPNLQSLSLLGTMAVMKFRLRLMNIQSLDDCNLNFERTTFDEDYDNGFEEQQKTVGELLERLRHVKKLTIGNWCIQVLSILELKGMLSPMLMCNYLVLDTDIMKCDLPGIAGLLQCSLNLETLVINMTSLYGLTSLHNSKYDENFPENFWTSESGCSKCSLLHLKTVRVVGFVARRREFRLVIPLVQFLLEKGRALENIVIKARSGNHMECSPKELHQVAQKLQNLPKISPYAEVKFSGYDKILSSY